MKKNGVLHQDRLIGAARRNVVLSRNVGRGHDRNHARRVANLAQIETAQRTARNRRAADRDMQRADRLGDIVDIFGAALHMLGAAVMRQRLVNVAQRRLEHVAIRRHRRVSGDPRRA